MTGSRFLRGGRSAVASAVLLLALSLVVLGAALWRAAIVEPLPSEAPVKRLQDVKPIERRVVPAGEVLVGTILNDPFRPDRKAPAERFLLPENRPTSGDNEAAFNGVAGTFLLLGTVVLPEGGAAMVEGEGESRIVRVGETFQGFRLRKVERGRAIFIAPDGSSETLEVDGKES